MDAKRRFKLLSILAGVEADRKVTHTLYLIDQMQEADIVVAWLLKQRIFGKRFKNFLEEEQYSPMRVVARIKKATVEEFTV